MSNGQQDRHKNKRKYATPSVEVVTRRCIVTRSKGAREALLRFVEGPDGELLFDVRQRLPGRGVYLKPRRRVIEQAIERKAFERGLKSSRLPKVEANALIDEVILPAIERCYHETLSMGRGSGQLVCGRMKVERATNEGSLVRFLLASDVSDNTRRKIEGAAKGEGLEVSELLDRDALGALVGRDQAVVLGWRDGSLMTRAVHLEEQLKGLGWRPTPREGGDQADRASPEPPVSTAEEASSVE